jgi:glycosyltransferase involved in cell wall biosynthesis
LPQQLRQVAAWRAAHRFICLVNLVQFDPPNNGGMSRVAKEVGRVLLEMTAADSTFQPVFLIKAELLDQMQQAFGTDMQTLAFNRYTSGAALRRLQPNLIISPLFGVEPLAGISRLEHVPHIASMPDALGLERADTFPPKIRAARRASYERLKTTTRVVTLSNYSKEHLVARLQIDPQKLVVIAPGADAVPHADDAKINFPWDEQPYVYYPANLWAHKRHDLLLQTMLEVWQERPDLRLVLTGSQAADFGIDFANLCRQYAIPVERVTHLGYVDDAQVGALYSRAYALLFVSKYDGVWTED